MKDFNLRQLFEPNSSTYTYLLSDLRSLEAVLIDPVLETVERDSELIAELKLNLRWIVETHVHADHVTGAARLRAIFPSARTAISERARVQGAGRFLKEGDEISFGAQRLRAIATPGHTNSCMSFYWFAAGCVFTGDTLLIRGTGRTDFQEGSSPTMFRSITERLFSLPPETTVYPGHDYKGHTSSTIGDEKALNPRVGAGRTEAEFIEIMKNLKLSPPQKLEESVRANLKGGLT